MSLLSSVILFAAAPAFATPVNVGPDAVSWAELFESYNTPANNDYVSPGSVTWSYDPLDKPATVAIANVKCGAWVSQAFQHGALVTADEIEDLTSSESPTAAEWYDAIDTGVTVDGLTIAEVTMANLTRGDLLVGKYKTATDTGHAMIVTSVRSTTLGHTLSVVPASPADATDDKWLLVVTDATRSPHGSTVSTTAAAQGVVRDTRNRDLDADGTEDEGMGLGTIAVYTDHDTGAITGWRWSYNGTYYTPTDRPLLAGRITDDI